MNKLEELPKLIRDKELALSTLNEQIFEVADQKARLELPTKIGVYDEITNTGKSVYSNEARRELEIDNRLFQDKEYQDVKQRLVSLLRQKEMVKIDCDNLKNELKVMLALIKQEE
jgi:hypothetical protein